MSLIAPRPAARPYLVSEFVTPENTASASRASQVEVYPRVGKHSHAEFESQVEDYFKGRCC